MTDLLTIEGTHLPVMTWQGQRVVTLDMVDRVHQRKKATARKRFNDNRHRLLENEDYFEIDQASEIRTLGVVRPQGGTPEKLILLTESGRRRGDVIVADPDLLSWPEDRVIDTVESERTRVNRVITQLPPRSTRRIELEAHMRSLTRRALELEIERARHGEPS